MVVRWVTSASAAPSTPPSAVSVAGSATGSSDAATSVSFGRAVEDVAPPDRPRPRPPRDRFLVVPPVGAVAALRSTSPGCASRSISGCSVAVEVDSSPAGVPSGGRTPSAVPAPDPDPPRPPRPRPPRRRLRRAPDPGGAEPPPSEPVVGSVGSRTSVPEVVEPLSSFIVAPFASGGAMAAFAEGWGSSDAPERLVGRRVGTGGPDGLASSDLRTDVGSSPCPCGASLRTRKSPFSAGSSGRGPPGSDPGPAWPVPRLSLPRRFLAAPWPQPGGQTWNQGYRTHQPPAATSASNLIDRPIG